MRDGVWDNQGVNVGVGVGQRVIVTVGVTGVAKGRRVIVTVGVMGVAVGGLV